MLALRECCGAAFLGLAASACSLPGMEFEAVPLGGVDRDGAGDELHFELRNVAGFSSGFWALVLPSDWRQRATEPDVGSGARLVEPLAPEWTPITDVAPAAERVDGRLLNAFVDVLDLKYVRAVARARARDGRDSYFATRNDTPSLRRYVLYGVVASGPGDDAELTVVRIGELTFRDERNLLVWSIDLGVRVTTGAAGFVLFLPVMIVGTLLQGNPTS
ncbi:MAG: hypothetical protein R3F49_07825 [Planctomycetota bacterium]